MSLLGGCVIGSQLGHVLIGQADGNAAHGRMATVAAAGMALLLFALEGVICIAMAMPLLLPRY